MRLNLISQDTNNDYDTYDSAVVAAKNEEMARHTQVGFMPNCSTWVKPDKVKAELIGTAIKGTEQGVICSSFNAG